MKRALSIQQSALSSNGKIHLIRARLLYFNDPGYLKTTICEKTIRFCPEQEARAHSSLRPICGGLMTDRRAQRKKASTPHYARKDGSSELEDYACAGIDVLDVVGQRCSSGQCEEGA